MATDQPVPGDKGDPIKMDSEESPPGGSSVDEESGELGEGEGEGEGGLANATPEQAPKRKGGRKPIYATTEERKQRNRQAQAAFRERRTEYIKQLESTINMQEASLNNLNAAHRHTTDECLMLRYKNSLLERILLEKGIDVQVELHAKHGSSNFGPTHPVPMVPPPIPRTLLNRHNARRSTSSIAPKIETGYPIPAPVQPGHLPAGSTQPRGTAASPTSAEGFAPSPASSDNIPNVMRPIKQAGHHHMGGSMATTPARMMPPIQPQQMGHPQAAGGRMGGGGAGQAFYNTPQYQSHLEQLEQEYDVMDDQQQQQQQPSVPDQAALGPYPGTAYAAHAAAQEQQSQMSPRASTAAAESARHQQQQQQQHPQQHQQDGMAMAGMVDPMGDPAIDWDPFGLSASMAFPTSFSFDTSNMR